MEVVNDKGLECFADDSSDDLTRIFDPEIITPNGLNVTPREIETLTPFLWVANATQTFYGFSLDGYTQILSLMETEGSCNLRYARDNAAGGGLSRLVGKGFLRVEEHEGHKVYFPTEKLAREVTRIRL